MLVWAAVLHVVVIASLIVASVRKGSAATRSTPVMAWMVPGAPGAVSSGDGGGTPAPPPPKLEPPPPEEKVPRVVRPTKEDRDQLPLPDAKSTKREPPKPSSGLTGRDASSAPSAQLKTDASSGGLGLGGTGGGSPFDSDFEYDYYVHQMLAKVKQNWQRVPVTRTAIVIVKFTIFRDGHLEDVEVEQSSAVSVLDRGAERAVYLADPMPPLPNSFPRDRVGVHLRFEYSDR